MKIFIDSRFNQLMIEEPFKLSTGFNTYLIITMELRMVSQII